MKRTEHDMAHVETMYVLKRKGRGNRQSQIEHRLFPSIHEAWRVMEDEKGIDRQSLRVGGWEPVKVVVQEV